MFDVGFSEIVVICGLALIVLGPQKLPRIAASIGRWVGRARSMARQFREQLEREAADLEEQGKSVRESMQDVASSLEEASAKAAELLPPRSTQTDTPHLDLTPPDFPPPATTPQDYSHLGAARGGPGPSTTPEHAPTEQSSAANDATVEPSVPAPNKGEHGAGT